MIRTLLVSAIATSAFIAAIPAAAQENFSVKVQTSDINLSTGVGERLLEQRIGSTIARMCGRADPREVAASAAVAKCHKDAWATARPQIAVNLAAAKAAASTYRVASR